MKRVVTQLCLILAVLLFIPWTTRSSSSDQQLRKLLSVATQKAEAANNEAATAVAKQRELVKKQKNEQDRLRESERLRVLEEMEQQAGSTLTSINAINRYLASGAATCE